jgi:predicted O-methyltransferase YrrM
MRSVCQGTILAASLALAFSFTPSPRTGTFRRHIYVADPSIDVSSAESESKNASRPGISLQSSTFGKLTRVRMPGEDDSFLGAMGVPTYATMVENEAKDSVIDTCESPKARGLEGVINQGPAFMLDNVLSKEVCESMIRDCGELGFGNYNSGRNHHGALQILVSPELANAVGQRLSRHVDVSEVEARRAEMMEGSGTLPTVEEDVRLVYAGLNRRWRIYRYDSVGDETFAPHIDAGFPPSGLSEDGKELLWDASDPDGEQIVSRLTVLMYLNDDFVGGETNFYQPVSSPKALSQNDESAVIASVRPVAGSCLVFPQGVGEEAVDYARKHWPLHEGSPVLSGRPKYVIRSDVLFATQKDVLPLDDKMLRYDHLVRQAFMPTSDAMDRNFLSHLASLYNPHMGVENLGPMLYSFVRFTKKRRVVEIGAGYTSLWILQALKENDEEWERMRELQRSGKNRLLDIEWTIPSIVEEYDGEPASLLCIDNCRHQKETATGASAVSKALGLDSYMQFLKGDAFELELGEDSVDILWCDFGVGSRIREFVSSAWSCLRPGGFLLCHSTLTNLNTREWLEAARARKGEDITGIPPDEYVEISLLEPQKRFQNSISIFQKRKASDGRVYEEPVYSKYA